MKNQSDIIYFIKTHLQITSLKINILVIDRKQTRQISGSLWITADHDRGAGE